MVNEVRELDRAFVQALTTALLLAFLLHLRLEGLFIGWSLFPYAALALAPPIFVYLLTSDPLKAFSASLAILGLELSLLLVRSLDLLAKPPGLHLPVLIPLLPSFPLLLAFLCYRGLKAKGPYRMALGKVLRLLLLNSSSLLLGYWTILRMVELFNHPNRAPLGYQGYMWFSLYAWLIALVLDYSSTYLFFSKQPELFSKRESNPFFTMAFRRWGFYGAFSFYLLPLESLLVFGVPIAMGLASGSFDVAIRGLTLFLLLFSIAHSLAGINNLAIFLTESRGQVEA